MYIIETYIEDIILYITLLAIYPADWTGSKAFLSKNHP